MGCSWCAYCLDEALAARENARAIVASRPAPKDPEDVEQAKLDEGSRKLDRMFAED